MPDPYDRQQALAAMNDKPQAAQAAQAEASALARLGDPSLPSTKSTEQTPQAARRRGIEWVRLSDLLTRGGISAANRGAVNQENVIRRMRTSANPVSRRGIARKSAPSLPPVTAFGQTPPPAPGTAVTR